jgi:serine protease Do
MKSLLLVLLAVTITLGAATSSLGQDLLTIEREMTRVVDELSGSIVSVSAISTTPTGPSGKDLSRLRAVAKSVGCGVVFDESGLIVTTASVVGYARYVDVTATSGAKYKGTVLGIDPTSDVAVIQVENADLKPARFADRTSLRPGSIILVLGNAFGALPSVSMGVLSNVTGSMASERDLSMLRISVPINPGDIGGPVVSTSGEVIGLVIGRLTFQSQMHSMRVGDRGVFGFSGGMQPSNMSIAIPSVRLMSVTEDILDRGSTRRGFLGIQVMDLSDELRRELGENDLRGVMVTSVVPGSPAESIGIVPGDVITSFGPKPIDSITGLGDAVGTTMPGDLVDIKYMRDGRDLQAGVRIGWFVPEFVRQATFMEYMLKPEQVRSRIEDLKTEMERLEEELEEIEKGN